MNYGEKDMDEIALNILDIAYNSIRAHASLIKIIIVDSKKNNLIDITIQDNGDGMDKTTLSKVTDPFYTTRTTRKVGLGIPLLKQVTELTGGYLHISSLPGQGTTLQARFIKNHIDTPMMGNMTDTMLTLIQANENIDYIFEYSNDQNNFSFDTKEMKSILGDVKINEPEVLLWLKDYIKEGLEK